MNVKPTEGLKVKVAPTREAIFGEEGVEVKKISASAGKGISGVLTGRTLVGYAEVEIKGPDGKKHWYPVDQLTTENGDKVEEEEVVIEEPADDSGDEVEDDEE